VIGASAVIDRNGNAGGALQFDGIDDYVDIEQLLFAGDDMTVAFWAASNGTLNAIEVMVSQGHASDQGFAFQNDWPTNGDSTFIWGASGTSGARGLWSVLQFGVNHRVDSGWHHFAVTKTGATIKIFLDGALVTQLSHDLVFGSFRFNIGRDTFNAGPENHRTFNGAIDDVYVYDNALTELEIAALMNNVVPTANVMPTAVAGADQSIRAGDTVFLDGSDSFDDNTATVDLDYQWSITGKPVGSAATLDFPTSDMPSFVAVLVGTYDVELVVTDEDGASSSADPVQISTNNIAPTSDAGVDQLVIIGDPVLLDGSGSTDPEGDEPLTFAWAFTSVPGGSIAALSGDNTAFPSFTPDLEGSYVVELTASDFIGPGAPDSVEITATNGEEFEEIQIIDASEEIALIPPEEVTTVGNQTAFTKFLQQAMTAILEDDIERAIDKLEKSIIRTDGCVLRGSPDLNGKGRDWIIGCAAQTDVYDLLTSALDALTQS